MQQRKHNNINESLNKSRENYKNSGRVHRNQKFLLNYLVDNSELIRSIFSISSPRFNIPKHYNNEPNQTRYLISTKKRILPLSQKSLYNQPTRYVPKDRAIQSRAANANRFPPKISPKASHPTLKYIKPSSPERVSPYALHNSIN